MRLSLISFALLLALASAAASQQIGSAPEGATLIRQVGCGSCHIIPGIVGARGLVGPPLIHMSRRIYIAGLLRNTPQNMVRWLMHPQSIVRGNAMPEMGLTQSQARNIAAYLATIK